VSNPPNEGPIDKSALLEKIAQIAQLRIRYQRIAAGLVIVIRHDLLPRIMRMLGTRPPIARLSLLDWEIVAVTSRRVAENFLRGSHRLSELLTGKTVQDKFHATGQPELLKNAE
jgi:hypothetical protein